MNRLAKKWEKILLAILLLAAGILTACIADRSAGGTGVGNPPQHAQAELAFAATSLSKTTTMAKIAGRDLIPSSDFENGFKLSDRGGMSLILTEARAHIGGIRIRLPNDVTCSSQLEEPCQARDIKLDGPFFADLISGVPPAELAAIRIPVGNYHRVDIKLDPYRPDSEPALREPEMAGYSMLLRGTFTYQGSANRTFVMLLRFDEEARIEAKDSIQVIPNALNRLRVALDVGKWFSQVDIGNCLDKGDLKLDAQGNLQVDTINSCGELEKDLKTAIKSSGRFEKVTDL